MQCHLYDNINVHSICTYRIHGKIRIRLSLTYFCDFFKDYFVRKDLHTIYIYIFNEDMKFCEILLSIVKIINFIKMIFNIKNLK